MPTPERQIPDFPLPETEPPPGGVRLLLDPSGRIAALDGLRALACAMVIVQHYLIQTAAEGSPFAFLKAAPRVMFGGVDLFFVLSGFLIGGILFEARASASYYTTFYVRRALRLLPLYYLTIFTYLICRSVFEGTPFRSSALFQNPLPVWTYWLHLQNFAMAAFDTFGPLWLAGSWSLAIEEQFYFLLPPLVRNVGERTVLRIAQTAWLGSLGLRIANAKLGLLSPLTGGFVLIPFSLDGLAMGVAIAYAIRYERELVERVRPVVPWLAGIGLLLWITYSFVTPWGLHTTLIFQSTVNSLVFGSTLLSVLLFPTSWLARVFSTRPLRAMGNWSYHAYLTHQIVAYSVFYSWSGAKPTLARVGDLAGFALSLGIVFTVAAASWKYFEKPLLSIGHRFRY